MAWWEKFTKEASLIRQSDNQIEEVLGNIKYSTNGLACCLSKILPRTEQKLKELGYRVEIYSDFFFIYNYDDNKD